MLGRVLDDAENTSGFYGLQHVLVDPVDAEIVSWSNLQERLDLFANFLDFFTFPFLPDSERPWKTEKVASDTESQSADVPPDSNTTASLRTESTELEPASIDPETEGRAEQIEGMDVEVQTTTQTDTGAVLAQGDQQTLEQVSNCNIHLPPGLMQSNGTQIDITDESNEPNTRRSSRIRLKKDEKKPVLTFVPIDNPKWDAIDVDENDEKWLERMERFTPPKYTVTEEHILGGEIFDEVCRMSEWFSDQDILYIESVCVLHPSMELTEIGG